MLLSQRLFLSSFSLAFCELKVNDNKTKVHLKVTETIQRKISSNIHKLTQKKIKKTYEQMPENKKPFLLF